MFSLLLFPKCGSTCFPVRRQGTLNVIHEMAVQSLSNIWACVLKLDFDSCIMCGTHVNASEHMLSSSLWSWDSWLFVCSHSKWCWSSSVCRAFLSWSTSSCASLSFWQSWSLRWRRFSRWTMNDCTSSNCDTHKHTNTHIKGVTTKCKGAISQSKAIYWMIVSIV